MKKYICLFMLFITYAVNAQAQPTEIIELPKPPIPNIKDIKIPQELLDKVDIECQSRLEKNPHFHFIEPSSIGQEYGLGQEVWFKWGHPIRHSGFFGFTWNKVDRYTMILTDPLGKHSDTARNGGDYGNPVNTWRKVLPCDPGFYLLTIIAEEWRTKDDDKFVEFCRITTVIRISGFVFPPAAQAHLVCKPATYRLHVPNPQDADKLYRLEDSHINDPGYDPEYDPNLLDVGIKDESTGDFYYDVPVTESDAFWLMFSKRGCKYEQISVAPQVDTVYYSIYSKPSPVAILLIDLDLYKIKEDTTDLASKYCDINFYPLDANLFAVNTKITDELKEFKALESDILASASPTFHYSWDSTKYTTDYSYEVTNGETGTTKIYGKKVCWNNLPEESGSCRTYTMNLKVFVKIALKDADSATVIGPTYHCYKDSLIVKTVCKAMFPPPTDIIVDCDTIDKITIPNSKYYSARWTNSANEVVATGFENCNYDTDAEECKGFSYANFNESNANRKNYALTVRYVTSQGRVSLPGIIQVIPIPQPDEVIAGFSADYDAPKIKRPVSNQNDDNACREPDTFFDLDQNLNENAERYIDHVSGFVDDLEIENNLLDLPLPKLEITWKAEEPAKCYFHENFNALPTDTATVDRVCYGDLPPENESCCYYIGTVKISSKARLISNMDDTLITNNDTLAKENVNCEATIFRVKVCKEPETGIGSCLTDDSQLLNYVETYCRSHELVQVCPENTYTIGTDSVLPGFTYTYEWPDTSYFLYKKDKNNAQYNLISYDSLNIAVGAHKTYDQHCYAYDALGNRASAFDFIHCVVLYKCENCSGETPFLERKSSAKPGQEESHTKPELNLYPNPAGHTVHIDYHFESGDGVLVIMNLLGQEVSRLQLAGSRGTASLSTDKLPEGHYICTLISDQAMPESRIFTVKR